jgi:hypothetical protein
MVLLPVQWLQRKLYSVKPTTFILLVAYTPTKELVVIQLLLYIVIPELLLTCNLGYSKI